MDSGIGPILARTKYNHCFLNKTKLDKTYVYGGQSGVAVENERKYTVLSTKHDTETK